MALERSGGSGADAVFLISFFYKGLAFVKKITYNTKLELQVPDGDRPVLQLQYKEMKVCVIY